MTTPGSERFTIPPVYSPTITWGAWTGLFLLFSLYEMPKMAALLTEQVAVQFNWDGHATRLADKNWWTMGLPTWYGALTAGVLYGIAHRIQPTEAREVIPPTPLAGFLDHLSRSIAASLLQLTAAYMAFIGMAVQFGMVHVTRNLVEIGQSYRFNNTWMIFSLLVYCAYAGWLLLVFNREVKRGQYGSIALEGGEPVPPAVPRPPRAPAPKPRTDGKRSAGQPVE